MKKTYSKIIALFSFLIAIQTFTNAQCISTNPDGLAIITSALPGMNVVASNCNYGGDYNTITFSVTGVFSFSTNVLTDYITITDNSNNIVAFGNSPLNSVSIPSVGMYRFHVSASAPPGCSIDNLCRTSVVFVPLPACSGQPIVGITASAFSVCPNSTALLTTTISTPVSGLTYQWASATSSVGPYSNIPGAIFPSYTTSTITSTVWYHCVVTCSAGPISSTTTPVSISLSLPVINTVPYFESFEGITYDNQFPNCSWASSSTSFNCQTYTSSTINNRVPHTGNNFAAFQYNNTFNGEYFYTNGILLNAGTTYSASTFYITDGANGWSEFSLLYGTSQSTVGLTNIASVVGTITNVSYTPLSNTFTVPTTGVYYIAVKNVSNYNPWYFTWDDLSIIALQPCSGSPASNTTIASSPSVCVGGQTSLSLATTYTTAGITYQWGSSNNSNGPYISIPGATLSTYTPTGIVVPTWYSCMITCVSSAMSTTSTPIQIGMLGAPVYTTVPFLENFDNVWQNRCDIKNVPVAANWNDSPSNGDNSWRRQDDGNTANWTSSWATVWPLTGAGCANFHTYDAPYLAAGNMDLYIDMGTSSTNYNLSFYYVNIDGDDSLQVLLSINGGNTFTPLTTFLSGSYSAIDTTWNKKILNLGSVNSPSCVIRFLATSDYGASDIGMDSLKITSSVCISPTVSITASAYTVCSGSAVVLSASGATSYTWSTGPTSASISLSPTVSTIYSVMGSTGGCTTTKTISIIVNPQPTVNSSPIAPSICNGGSITLTANGAATYSWSTGATTNSILVTPAVTTTYTLIATNTVGCSNTKTISVSVAPQPTIVAITSSSTVCAGDSATLTASGATNYTWNPGGLTTNTIVVTPTINTTYTIVGVTGICTDVTVKTISVMPLPLITINPASITICLTSGSTTLTASGSNSYTWAPTNFAGPANVPAIIVSPTASIIYSVSSISAVNGCIGVQTVSVNVANCAGISKNNSGIENTFIYPNPTKGVITVFVENTTDNYLFEIFDMTGKLVFRTNLDKTLASLSVKDLANGLYMYKLSNLTRRQISKTGKLIKE